MTVASNQPATIKQEKQKGIKSHALCRKLKSPCSYKLFFNFLCSKQHLMKLQYN